jgi:hypothetical protein
MQQEKNTEKKPLYHGAIGKSYEKIKELKKKHRRRYNVINTQAGTVTIYAA